MNTLVLNRANLLSNGKNNILVYKFPRSVMFKDAEIAVSQVSMYYSWYNISSALANNTFSYTWVDGNIFSVVIPDGLYEIADINSFLQSTMITNNHYLVNATGDNVYYLNMEVNSSRYAVQINTFAVPADLTAANALSLSIPTNGSFVFPTGNRQNVVFSAQADFHKIIGFDSDFSTNPNLSTDPCVPPAGQTYIAINASKTISYISYNLDNSSYVPGVPDVQPNSSVLLNIDKVTNEFANPTGIIMSVVPNVPIGGLINERPTELTFAKLTDGTYNELRVQFLGTDLNEIHIQDPEMTVLLVIKT